MLELKVTNQFRKDYKMVKKRGYDVNLFLLHPEQEHILIYFVNVRWIHTTNSFVFYNVEVYDMDNLIIDNAKVMSKWID